MAKLRKNKVKVKSKPKKKRREEELEEEQQEEKQEVLRASNLPYADSDRAKDFLIRSMIVLCFIAFGLMVYSIRYIRYVNRQRAEAAAEAAAVEAAQERAAERAAAEAEIWFSRPDGTFVKGNGTSAAPELPSQQQTPSAETPAESEAPAEGQAPAEGGEGTANESAPVAEAPPQPA